LAVGGRGFRLQRMIFPTPAIAIRAPAALQIKIECGLPLNPVLQTLNMRRNSGVAFDGVIDDMRLDRQRSRGETNRLRIALINGVHPAPLLHPPARFRQLLLLLLGAGLRHDKIAFHTLQRAFRFKNLLINRTGKHLRIPGRSAGVALSFNRRKGSKHVFSPRVRAPAFKGILSKHRSKLKLIHTKFVIIAKTVNFGN
jgi:hypothetical protein